MLSQTEKPAGKFIVIEGVEGAGKTTAIQTVAEVLAQHGISELIFTREPGGTPLAEALRDIIKDGVHNEVPCSKAELLLFYAARIQLVDTVIKPALKAGKWVIGDRHDLSTQAYQGGGRQLDQAFMQNLKQQVLADFKPDLTLYLDIPPQLSLARAQARGELDRIEQESLAFFERTRQRYQQLAAADRSIITIDATQTLSDVTQTIRQQLSQWLSQL